MPAAARQSVGGAGQSHRIRREEGRESEYSKSRVMLQHDPARPHARISGSPPHRSRSPGGVSRNDPKLGLRGGTWTRSEGESWVPSVGIPSVFWRSTFRGDSGRSGHWGARSLGPSTELATIGGRPFVGLLARILGLSEAEATLWKQADSSELAVTAPSSPDGLT
jgi:hypothetical protein